MPETNPPAGLAADFRNLAAPGAPAVLLIGTQLALLGTYTGTVDVAPRTAAGQHIAAAYIRVPACSCPDPDTDIDPRCDRHHPEPPAELLALVAKAVAASRGWSHRAGMGPRIDGCTDLDVNAAEAVLAVLLDPSSHGVFR